MDPITTIRHLLRTAKELVRDELDTSDTDAVIAVVQLLAIEQERCLGECYNRPHGDFEEPLH